MREQLRVGDGRFYWTYASEGELLHPPGISGCSPKSDDVVRTDKVIAQDHEADPSIGAARACLDVAYNYKLRFNRSMATLHPASIALNCVGSGARIDRSLAVPTGAQSRADALSRLERQQR